MADPAPLTDVVVQLADSADIDELVIAARACGQNEEGLGADPRYLMHVLRRGVMALATVQGEPAGFAGSIEVAGVRMLTDLFVAPHVHRSGIGRRLLDLVWSGSRPKMTFASAHPAALSLYLRRALTLQWPLHYLVGEPARLPEPTLAVDVVPAAAAADTECEISGIDRGADYEYWTSRPRGWAGVARRGGEIVAAFAVGGGEVLQLDHAVAQRSDAVPAVLAVLHAMGSASRDVSLCVPGRHLVLPVLLNSGFRIVDTDNFMATADVSLDLTTYVLHPGLA